MIDTLNLNSTACRRKETFPLKTVSESREVPQDAVMALSLPEHLTTQEATGHGKMRVKLHIFHAAGLLERFAQEGFR